MVVSGGLGGARNLSEAISCFTVLLSFIGAPQMTDASIEKVCPRCGGLGRVRVQQSFYSIEITCPVCRPGAAPAFGEDGSAKPRSGYVYILMMTAGVLKIGHTQRHPKDRADEWKLELLAYARCEDSAKAEQLLHDQLSAYRKGAYELFEISFSDALAALERVAGVATILRRP